jgi:hypothetical protein
MKKAGRHFFQFRIPHSAFRNQKAWPKAGRRGQFLCVGPFGQKVALSTRGIATAFLENSRAASVILTHRRAKG